MESTFVSSSVERAAKREHNRILGLKAREELAMLLQSENPPKEKIEELQKTIQSKECAAYHTLPENNILRSLHLLMVP
jgi:hypothetical protein